MKSIQISFLLCLYFLSACDSYTRSGEEDDKLVEAQKLHNESMAIFAETLPMIRELTELRTNISKDLGMTIGDTTSQSSINSSDTTNTENTSDNAKKDNKPATNKEEAPTDTSANPDSRKVLENLNKAQADLLGWMRNIYKVPNMEGIYEEEKAREGAVGQDHDSEMLRTDMEFKTLPDDATSEEILEKQKEMKEEIVRIREEIKQTIEKAKEISLN